MQNQFESDDVIAEQINILKRGTTVRYGNLLTFPVGGGLLYVEPVYVQAEAATSFPLLRKVLVSFGDEVAFEDTLDEALDTLFADQGGNPAATTARRRHRRPSRRRTARSPARPAADTRRSRPRCRTPRTRSRRPRRRSRPATSPPTARPRTTCGRRSTGPSPRSAAARRRATPVAVGEPVAVAVRLTPRFGGAAGADVESVSRRGVEQLGSSLGS